MANNVGNLSVTITAVDKFTAVADKITGRVNNALEPSRRLSGALSKLGDTTGISRLNAGLATARSGALGAASSMSGLGFAAGAAGIGAAAAGWASFGSTLNKNARALQMSASNLHALQGAARLTGLDADAATQGVGGLGQAIYDALGPGGEEKATAFNRFGISLKDATGRARTGADAIGEVADAVARLNHAPREQRQLAAIFGVEDLLPLLRKGKAGMADLTAEARKLGTMSDADAARAEKMSRQWDRLSTAGQNFGIQVLGRMAEKLEPQMVRLTKAVEGDGGSGARRTGEAMAEVVEGATGLASKLDGLVTSTVGWRTATELAVLGVTAKYTGLFRVLGAGFGLVPPSWWLALLNPATLAAATAALTLRPSATNVGEDEQVRKKNDEWRQQNPGKGSAWNDGGPAPPGGRAAEADIFQGLVRRGLSPAEAAGVSANAMRESGGKLDAVNRAGGGIGAHGLFQWRADRARMENGGIASEGTLDQQLDHFMRDREKQRAPMDLAAGRPEARGYGAGSAGQHGYIYSRGYERHGDPVEDAKRAREAEAVYQRNAVPAVPATALNGSVGVDIRLRGAPAGTTASARTNGIATAAPPRVETAMPNGALP